MRQFPFVTTRKCAYKQTLRSAVTPAERESFAVRTDGRISRRTVETRHRFHISRLVSDWQQVWITHIPRHCNHTSIIDNRVERLAGTW
jgi:hypothetical protein